MPFQSHVCVTRFNPFSPQKSGKFFGKIVTSSETICNCRKWWWIDMFNDLCGGAWAREACKVLKPIFKDFAVSQISLIIQVVPSIWILLWGTVKEDVHFIKCIQKYTMAAVAGGGGPTSFPFHFCYIRLNQYWYFIQERRPFWRRWWWCTFWPCSLFLFHADIPAEIRGGATHGADKVPIKYYAGNCISQLVHSVCR